MRALMTLLLLALVACGPSPQTAPQGEAPIDFEILSHGTAYDLAPKVVPGAITVFDFYADWCPPCKKLERSLVNLKRTYGERLVIYQLDIVQWGSELTTQHGITDLPHLVVYGVDGKLLAKGPSAQILPEVIAALNRK